MTVIRKIRFLIFGIVLLSILSCSQKKETENDSSENQIKDSELIKQAEEDLLIGLSDAICYSGFRNGQYPDRGEGAINPSYQEIYEDLNILSKNFKLLRVYDSGENSEMVLKVIKENNIDMKVMLGIWLRAEISNHKNCEWLDSIPEETLKNNKTLNLEEIKKGMHLANEYPEIVVAVNVGNEALVSWTDHLVDVDTMISYVKHVKNSIKQPVTVAENYNGGPKVVLILPKSLILYLFMFIRFGKIRILMKVYRIQLKMYWRFARHFLMHK